jgi:hypothetical protein
MDSFWLWIPFGILVVMIAVLVAWYLWDRYTFNSAESEQITEVKDEEWATELHSIVETERMDVTAGFDARWLMTHCDLEDIAESLIEATDRVIDEAVRHLLDDSQWPTVGTKEEGLCLTGGKQTNN